MKADLQAIRLVTEKFDLGQKQLEARILPSKFGLILDAKETLTDLIFMGMKQTKLNGRLKKLIFSNLDMLILDFGLRRSFAVNGELNCEYKIKIAL